MGLREAIQSVPAKPGIAIALILTVAVGAWHGYTTYSACAHRARLTQQLHQAILAASGSAAAELRIAELFGPDWNKVRVFQGYKPQTPSLNCPFEWHWSSAERNQIAEQGNLTILGLYKDQAFLDFVDYRGDWATFDLDDKPVDRAKAVFAVSRPDNNGPFFLRPEMP